jgi:hypothetical protein
LKGPRRDDDGTSFDRRPVVKRGEESSAPALEADDSCTEPDGNVEVSGVPSEVVGDLVPRRVAVLVAVQKKAWKVAEGTRGKEGQRVVSLPPAVADLEIALDEFEAGAGSAKVIADGQSGLTRADDEHVPNGARGSPIGLRRSRGHQSGHRATVPSVDSMLIDAAT